MAKRAWVAGALAAVLVAAAGGGAWAADPNSTNNADALTIRISPNVDFGVDVDTATAQFDTLETPGTLTIALTLNATHYFVSPASVTIVGNMNSQELKIRAEGKTAGGWTVDDNEAIEPDKVQVYALFATNRSSAPLLNEFESDSGRHLVAGGSELFAGEPAGVSENNDRTDNRYEIADGAMAGGANMDNLGVGTLRQLWLRLDTPSQSSVDGDQEIQVTLTASTGISN